MCIVHYRRAQRFWEVFEVFSMHATKPFAVGECSIIFAQHIHDAALRSAIITSVWKSNDTVQSPCDHRQSFEAQVVPVLTSARDRPLCLWANARDARINSSCRTSDDPLVRRVVAGFERRGMFHKIIIVVRLISEC